MFSLLFTPEIGLDGWSLFHVLIGVVVGYGVQNTNYKKLQKVNDEMVEEFKAKLKKSVKKLPKKISKKLRKRFDIDKIDPQRFQVRFDLDSVLMVAFFREALEMYLEQGQIIPGFAQLIHGQEHWFNRLILDPLMLVIGYKIVSKYPKLLRPSVVAGGVLFFSLVIP